MAFVLPTFNLTTDIWTAGTYPAGAPRLVDVPCQLRAPSASNAANAVPVAGATVTMIVLLPAGTDIRDRFNLPINSSDVLEIPKGSGRSYTVVIVDDIGKGFPNEHRFAVLLKVLGFPWPTPSP